MNLYTVHTACEVVGQWRVPGEPFPLTEAQARLLAPPYGSVVAPYVPPVAEPVENKNDGQHGNKRKNRRSAK